MTSSSSSFLIIAVVVAAVALLRPWAPAGAQDRSMRPPGLARMAFAPWIRDVAPARVRDNDGDGDDDDGDDDDDGGNDDGDDDDFDDGDDDDGDDDDRPAIPTEFN